MIAGLEQLWAGISHILIAPFEIAWNTVKAILDVFGIELSWSPLDVLAAAWSPIASFMGGLWGGVENIISGVWDFFSGLFSFESEEMIAGLFSLWNGVSAILTTPFDLAVSLIKAVFDRFSVQFSWSPLEVLRSAWSGVSDFIGGLFGGIGETISATWDKVSGFFSWWGGKEKEVAQVEVVAQLPTGLEASNPQAMITAAEASKELVDNMSALEGANLSGLSQAANALALDVSETKRSVLHNLDEIDAALSSVDYAYHGSRLMETLAQGMLAGKNHITQAMSSVLSEAREYLPSSPAKRGPLSDIHRLKFMETIASSIHASPLLAALNQATGQARGVMGSLMDGIGAGALDMPLEPLAVGGALPQPIPLSTGGSVASLGSFSAKFENHFHGRVDEKTVQAGNEDLMRQLEAWWKEKQNETKRRGY